MSDDDEYYEWEEEYLFEDLATDFVVSNHTYTTSILHGRCDATMQGERKKERKRD